MTRDEFSKPYLVALYYKNRDQSNIALTVNDLLREFDLPRDEYLEKEVLEYLNFLSVTRSPPGAVGPDEPIMITPNGKATAENWIEQGVTAPLWSVANDATLTGASDLGTGFGSGAFGVGTFAGPTRTNETEAETMQVPAADRVVTINHNSPEYKLVEDGLRDLLTTVHQNNEVGDSANHRERLLSTLHAAQALWQSTELKLIQIEVGVMMAVEDAGLALKKVGSLVTIGIIIDAIKHLIKSVTGIDF